MPYDYDQAKYKIVTAAKAIKMGMQPRRSYGYYVLISPKPPDSINPNPDFGIASWCDTKATATTNMAENKDAQKKGLNGCMCGSGKQRRNCCG